MPFDFSFVLGGGGMGTLESLPMILSIAAYVLSALGLSAMAQSRKIRHPWLAWVPVADIWILGSLSDQYHYVVKGEMRSRRKLLLTLKIITSILGTVIGAITFRSLIHMFFLMAKNAGQADAAELLLELLLHAGGVMVLMLPVSITLQVFRFMALYDIYKSCEPETATMFLVLSIFFRFTEPFFLFFNREKEKGMPARKACTLGNPAAAESRHGEMAAPETEDPEPQTTEFL